MTSDTIDTIETMLDGLLYDTEDPEVHFKIRTILSLLSVLKRQNDIARTALSASDVPDDLQDDLIELGYLS